jgi:hypothetical protein
MNGTPIPIRDKTTLLGITLDHTLTLGPHITQVAKDCTAKALMLYKLSRCTRLPAKLLRTIYRAYIERKLCYAAPILTCAAQIYQNKLQIVQNKALSICFKLPKGMWIKQMHKIAEMPMIRDRLDELAINWYNKAKQNDIHNVRQIEQMGNKSVRIPPLHYLSRKISKLPNIYVNYFTLSNAGHKSRCTHMISSL